MLRLLLPLLHTVSAGPPPEPPFGLRIEYLGAAAADPTAPLPPPATPGECAASSVFVGGVASEWKVGSTSVPAAPLALSCPHGRTIEHIEAFFGDPTGSCAAGFTKGQCDSPTAQAVVDALCLHKASCTVPTQYNESHWKGVRFPSPLSSLFLPDPCEGRAKQLAVALNLGCIVAIHDFVFVSGMIQVFVSLPTMASALFTTEAAKQRRPMLLS